MEQSFSRVGWWHFNDPSFAPLVARCASRKDQLIPAVSKVVTARVGVSFDQYRPEHLKEFSLMKSILRGLLRYDADVRRLGYAVADGVSQTLASGKDEMYCTPPYPYLHFPQDASESSALHVDAAGHKGEYLTAWVPLQATKDQAVTIIPRSHKPWHANRTLSWVERRTGLRNIPWFYERSVAPDVNEGEFLVWTGRTHHAGNLNRSTRPRVVLNFRVSTYPEMLEPTRRSRDLGDGAGGGGDDTDPVAYATRYLDVFEAIEEADLLRPGVRLDAAVQQADDLVRSWKLSTMDSKRVAFGLALGTMRRKSTDPDVASVNLVAALLQPEYLWPLNSFIEYASRSHDTQDIARVLEAYMERHPFVQVAHALRKIAAREAGLRGLRVPSDDGLALVQWN